MHGSNTKDNKLRKGLRDKNLNKLVAMNRKFENASPQVRYYKFSYSKFIDPIINSLIPYKFIYKVKLEFIINNIPKQL